MRLHEHISALAQFGTLETGHGPRHPIEPNPGAADEIAAFFKDYPFVRNDRGYVEFLECYAGLLVSRTTDCLSLSIYGFDSEVSLHLTKDDGNVLTKEGFLTFADAAVPIEEGRFNNEDPQGVAFGFDATNERRRGVYRCLSNQPYSWYAVSFEDWLALLVSLRGRWV